MKIKHRQIRDRDHGIISEWHEVTGGSGAGRCRICGRTVVRGMGRWWQR